mmetsp:Transcript_10776/g.32128  ORF Transcript_10776/g.32128 Transcript_10776/m.32128 type:complete len:236 (+) Transcript_10776:108-815(+)
MSRPLSDGPATHVMGQRRRRALGYDDLPPVLQDLIQDFAGNRLRGKEWEMIFRAFNLGEDTPEGQALFRRLSRAGRSESVLCGQWASFVRASLRRRGDFKAAFDASLALSKLDHSWCGPLADLAWKASDVCLRECRQMGETFQRGCLSIYERFREHDAFDAAAGAHVFLLEMLIDASARRPQPIWAPISVEAAAHTPLAMRAIAAAYRLAPADGCSRDRARRAAAALSRALARAG